MGEFVFPSIAWEPKGGGSPASSPTWACGRTTSCSSTTTWATSGRRSISRLGCRSPNRELLDRLLEMPQAAGKDDTALTRLAQYRVLEHKLADREQATAPTRTSCAPATSRSRSTRRADEAERVLELVNRSNQLNFTKSRLTAADLEELLADPARRDAGRARGRPLRRLRARGLLLGEGRPPPRLRLLVPHPAHGRRAVGLRAARAAGGRDRGRGRRGARSR